MVATSFPLRHCSRRSSKRAPNHSALGRKDHVWQNSTSIVCSTTGFVTIAAKKGGVVGAMRLNVAEIVVKSTTHDV